MKDETEKVPPTEVWWSCQYYGFTGTISNCLVSDNPGSLDVVNSQKKHSTVCLYSEESEIQEQKKSQAHKLHIICWFAVWIEQIALSKFTKSEQQ